MTDVADGITGCPECPDGHRNPNRRPWSVFAIQHRDGPPQGLQVAPSAGGHVAESDAAWLRELIRRGRVELDVPPSGGQPLDLDAIEDRAGEYNVLEDIHALVAEVRRLRRAATETRRRIEHMENVMARIPADVLKQALREAGQPS